MKNMKWVFCGVGLVLFAGIILAHCSKLRGHKTDCIDGGVVTHSTGDNAPKVIESTEINTFLCEISLLTESDPGKLGNRVYTFKAERTDRKVLCLYEWYGSDSGKTTFETDTAFLDSLQKIVSEYNLARYNGFCHTVSGLPDMFGEKISIEYESGESIYAHDNQSRFMPTEIACALCKLFDEASGMSPRSFDVPE